MNNYHVGLIVPSSNTTMETEIPAILRARKQTHPERFSSLSSRMRMKRVTPEELRAVDMDLRCTTELADARVDVVACACRVAIMAQGQGYHRDSQKKLAAVEEDESGKRIPVVSSTVLDAVQQNFDIPVISAASASVWRIRNDLGLEAVAPRAGALLGGG